MVRLSLIAFDLDANCLPVRVSGYVIGDPATVGMSVKLRLRAPGMDQIIASGMMGPAPGGIGGGTVLGGSGAAAGEGQYFFTLTAELPPVTSAVPSALRRFWCLYAVVAKATGLEASPLVCKGCGNVEVDPEPHSDVVTTPSPTPATAPNRCSCYCFVGWITATAATDVPDPGQPTYSGWLTQVETTIGSVKQSANVNRKDYNCPKTTGIAAPIPAVALTPLLTHHRYTDTRTRSRITLWVKWGWLPWLALPWGAWSAWSAKTRVNGPVLSDREALATATPPLLPWCPDVGVPCP
jgi:hypothetical protein